ncbi:MAG: hypothetical protein Q8L20_11910 [Gammaproteobacteria bacterium]|nr:hypothetical protein [Gammaproteobacteria bacterium]
MRTVPKTDWIDAKKNELLMLARAWNFLGAVDHIRQIHPLTGSSPLEDLRPMRFTPDDNNNAQRESLP